MKVLILSGLPRYVRLRRESGPVVALRTENDVTTCHLFAGTDLGEFADLLIGGGPGVRVTVFVGEPQAANRPAGR